MPIYFSNPPISEPFAFDSVGNHWNQERTFRAKGFPHYHYLQTETGVGEIVIQEKSYLMKEGEGVLIAPFIRHSYSRQTKEWVTLFATFTGTAESSIATVLGNRPVILISKEKGIKIKEIINSAAKQYENPPVDAKSLSIDCYRLLMNFVDGVYTSELLKDPLYLKYVNPVVKEIETYFNTELTVQELSQQVYITPQYLSRLFGRFLGCSVYEYLTNYRITKAKEFLLTKPRMEVQDVAQQVGFLDTSHFISMFKKITGFTPLEFRKLN